MVEVVFAAEVKWIEQWHRFRGPTLPSCAVAMHLHQFKVNSSHLLRFVEFDLEMRFCVHIARASARWEALLLHRWALWTPVYFFHPSRLSLFGPPFNFNCYSLDSPCACVCQDSQIVCTVSTQLGGRFKHSKISICCMHSVQQFYSTIRASWKLHVLLSFLVLLVFNVVDAQISVGDIKERQTQMPCTCNAS